MKAYRIKTKREYCNEFLIGSDSASEALTAFLECEWNCDSMGEYDVQSVECLGDIDFVKDMIKTKKP